MTNTTQTTEQTERRTLFERVARWYHDGCAFRGRYVASEAYLESFTPGISQTRIDELLAESERGSQMANKHWAIARKYD